jgi:hypothetical protein
MPYPLKVDRQPGQPVPSQVGGAPMRPSMPNTFANPPAPASSPVGRPAATPSFAGGPGLPLPLSRPTSPPARPGMPVPPVPAYKQRAVEPRVGPRAGVRPDDWETQPPHIAVTPPVYQLDHVPSSSELAGLPPGANIQTPYGSVDHTGKLTLSAEGQAKYQQAVVQRRKSYGPHPWAGDPAAPPPPITLGKPSFNPFSGQWSR